MAIFDPREQRLCVRIVYDGVAGAGKTTNLQQLSAMFSAQKATEVYSPSEAFGRTLYFDWMQLPAGVVAGIPLLCQVISVPGQMVLGPRRRHLLEAADVIVYVCDSDRAALARAREGLDLVERLSATRGSRLPLVVQANKQDQVGAVDGRRVLEALDREGVPVIEAMAKDGVGVVDTFVGAIRSLSKSLQETAEREGLWLEVRRAETREAVHARLSTQAIDPEWAAELLLEEAAAAMRLEELASRASSELAALHVGETEGSLALPDADVPTGCVWPAHTGRSVLGRLAALGALSTRQRLRDDGTVCHRAGGHVMQTSTAFRFHSSDEARAALVRCARQRTQLEHLLAEESVVVVREADDGAWWLWTLKPDTPTLDDVLGRSDADPSEVRALLEAYGGALVDALRTSSRHGFGIDVRPECYGVHASALKYLAEPLPVQAPGELAAAIVEALLSLERRGLDVEVVIEAFEREQRRRLTREELEHARTLDHPALARLRSEPRTPAQARLWRAHAGVVEP